MREADTDQNGKIDFKEFMCVMLSDSEWTVEGEEYGAKKKKKDQSEPEEEQEEQEDDEAEEAGENAAVVLASEGEELEALGQDLQERWKAVWATRVECDAAEAKAEGGDDPEDDEAATTAGEDAI